MLSHIHAVIKKEIKNKMNNDLVLVIRIYSNDCHTPQQSWWHWAGWRWPRARQCSTHRGPRFCLTSSWWMVSPGRSSCRVLRLRATRVREMEVVRGAEVTRVTSSKASTTGGKDGCMSSDLWDGSTAF